MKFFFFLAMIFVAEVSLAKSWTDTPEFYSQYSIFSFEDLGLGAPCAVSLPQETTSFCTSAFLSRQGLDAVEAHLFMGGDYSKVFKSAEYLNNNDNVSLVRSVLDQTEPVEFNGFTSVGYTSEAFNVWLAPIHAYYFSSVRNSVSPEVHLVAFQESSLAARYRFEPIENLSVALQLSGFTRKFIAQQNRIYDVLADGGATLAPQNQNGIFFEPSIGYVEPQAWNFRVVASVKELGVVDKSYDEIPLWSRALLGIGSDIPLDPQWGQLEVLFSYIVGLDAKAHGNPVRVGSIYRVGLFEGFVGYDPQDFSIGANIGFDSLKVGLMFQQLDLDSRSKQIMSQASYVF